MGFECSALENAAHYKSMFSRLKGAGIFIDLWLAKWGIRGIIMPITGKGGGLWTRKRKKRSAISGCWRMCEPIDEHHAKVP